MSNVFGTKGVEVREGGFVGKYISYGIQQLAVMGFELKTAQSGKQMVILHMESPKVDQQGFEPDESAKIGGKVGRVNFTIYFSPSDENPMKDFLSAVALIAKKLNVSEAVDAIEASDLESYLNKLMPIIGGKMAWWAITGEEYLKKDGKIGYSLGLRRYGFVASNAEMESNPNHIKPFDKGNKYDYKPVAIPSADPDFNTQAPEDELPWS